MDRLPQNIQAMIGEIGEKQVLLRLYLLVRDTSWNVFHNLGEAGFDALLLHSKTGEKIRIEVKTRQALYTTGKHMDQVHFVLTDGEYQACDFLIGYHLDANDFYIIPKGELKKAPANGIARWRMVVTLTKAGKPHPRFEKYRNAWGRLHTDFASGKPGEPEEENAIMPEGEASSTGYWPELEEAVLRREEERLKIISKVNSDQLIKELEIESEKLFWAKEVQESLGANLDKMRALVETWDSQVFALVKQLAEASKLNTIWTIKTKVIAAPETRSHSLYWEVLFAWMGQSWYNIELVLDNSYQPQCFRVECKQPGNWLQTGPSLESLKTVLVEAYRLGKLHGQNIEEKPGWVLRSETGKRY
jgi:hypothetical protein